MKNETSIILDPFNVYEGWAGINMNQGIHKNGRPFGNISVVLN